jgi:acetyl/propionyl-CoA carboxylase alpha subunit
MSWGPAPSRESYLRGDKILDIARKSEAKAIHPGYGFLAERADFAQACLDAGIAFVGPKPSSIAAMGDKAVARPRSQKRVFRSCRVRKGKAPSG